MTNGKIHKERMQMVARRRVVVWMIFAVFLIASLLMIVYLFYIPTMMHINCLQSPPKEGEAFCEGSGKSLTDIQWRNGKCVWVCG